jgi:2-polyprenyl-3-methyl-5-hydroxy-6-metoxy-1,4-benzoquinol methylase
VSLAGTKGGSMVSDKLGTLTVGNSGSMSKTGYKDYGFESAAESHMHRHFLPQVFKFAGQLGPGTRVLDVGCGNGFTCGEFLRRGCKVVGIDLSEQGIALARTNFPEGRFEILGADQDILQNLAEEPFDLVVSTEVVEHLYAPREWAAGCYAALRPGGTFICTTPYHGYLKNLLISFTGSWDKHANPLWDGGHIKLWSRRTLSALLAEAGFTDLRFTGAGRLPGLWMTMVFGATKPLTLE